MTDADGVVQKLTKYYYTDGALTTEVNYLPADGTMTANTKVDYIYDSTGLAFVMVEVYNGDTYGVPVGKYTLYAKRNAQGDITSLTDITDGSIGDSVYYAYSAYGKRYIEDISGDLCSMVSELNSLTFKGYSYDRDLEMYYLGSRWYDPEICRFINGDDTDYIGADGSPLSYNLFSYCMNNPINRYDVNGNWPMPNWLKVTVGVAAIAGLAVATVCTGGAAAVICGAALSGAIAGGISDAVMGAIGGGISGEWQGALDGACSGFMSGTLIGGATGAASAGMNIATGATTVVGKAHGSILHKLATNMEAGKWQHRVNILKLV